MGRGRSCFFVYYVANKSKNAVSSAQPCTLPVYICAEYPPNFCLDETLTATS